MNQKPKTFEEVKDNRPLRLLIQDANKSYMTQISNTERIIEEMEEEFDALAQKIGLAIVNDEQPNVTDVYDARALQEKLKSLTMQIQALQDQARAAMYRVLENILPSDKLPTEEKLNALYEEMEHATRQHLLASRILSGMQE